MGLSSITLRQRFSATRPSLSDLRMLVQRCVPFARAQWVLAPNDVVDYWGARVVTLTSVDGVNSPSIARRGTVFYDPFGMWDRPVPATTTTTRNATAIAASQHGAGTTERLFDCT